MKIALVGDHPEPIATLAALLPADAEIVRSTDPAEELPAVDVVIAVDAVARTALARAPLASARVACVLGYGVDERPGAEQAEVDLWAVGHSSVAEAIVKAGVARDVIEVTGVPVPVGFEPPADRRSAREAVGIDPDRGVIALDVVALGDALDALLVQLALLTPPPVVLFDVGDDAVLADALRAVVPGTDLAAKMFAAGPERGHFTALADLVVGLPRALDAARAFAVGAAFVAIGRPPRGALEAALETGAARVCTTLGRLAADVDLLRQPDRLADARAAATRLAVPDARDRLVRIVTRASTERELLAARRRRRGLPAGLEDLASGPPRRPPPPSIEDELAALRKKLG